jgi:hypothetical protein
MGVALQVTELTKYPDEAFLTEAAKEVPDAA